MPGIFDTLIANGILSQLFGGNPAQAQAVPADPYDDTQRMLAKQKAVLSGQGSVTNPVAPAPQEPVPMMVQAMNSGQTTAEPAEIVDRSVYSADLPQGAPQVPQASQMSNFDKVAKALELAGRGFTIAGSKDPAAAYAAFTEMDKPKVTPLAGGAFSLVTKPDGTQQVVKNEEIAKYLSEQSDNKRIFELLKIKEKALEDARLAAQKKAQEEQVKNAGDTTQTELAVNELEDIAKSLEKTDSATGPAIGLVPKWARDIVTPEGSDLQDRAERIIQASLRQTLGSQFTEKEGARFLERAYNPRLDEKTNAARLRQVAKELNDIQANKDSALEYMRKNRTLDGFKPPQSSLPGRSGSGGSDLSAQAQSAFGSYDPNVYEYRINNGVLQRRKK